MKICMIVDDSPVIRKVAKRILELTGFVVLEAYNGEEAMSLCFENRPDLILVDWKMPNMSGTEFIAAYREMEKAHPIDHEDHAVATKIVFCTSELMVAEMMKAKRAGANGFLMKPFSRKMIEERLLELGLMKTQGMAA